MHAVQDFITMYNLLIMLNPFTRRVSYGDIKLVLTSESVEEIL